MKKILMLGIAALFSCVCVYAQDIITTKDGEDIKAKIYEVNPDDVKYRKYDNPDGPMFTLNKSDILIIRYENGENEVIKEEEARLNASEPVSEGMKYRELKSIYDTKFYTPQVSDPYSRGWAGVASFFVPGLGEGVAGEWGRGAIILAANIGLGAVVLADSPSFSKGATTMGTLGYCAVIARLGLNVWSIFDAVHIAKVKNMYYQDLKAQRTSLDFSVEPYFAYTPVGVPGLYQPAGGLSVKLNF